MPKQLLLVGLLFMGFYLAVGVPTNRNLSNLTMVGGDTNH
jgi:hypothetical protein